MKGKYAWGVLLALTLLGCDDNTGTLGLGMFPDGDQALTGRLSTFEVTTNSVAAGEVYAKSSIGYVGKFTDQTFGAYEAGFLAELNAATGLTFPAVYDKNTNPSGVMTSEKVYTTELVLFYSKSNYFGDSLNACRLSVYEMNQSLDPKTAYLTNIEATDYYNPTDLLGRKAYTAVDLSLSDSVRNLSTYTPFIRLTIPNAVGEKILAKSRECEANGTDFSDKFQDVFKGIYVKSDYGDGTVLYIDQIQMNVVYERYAKNDTTNAILQTYDGKDSTYYSKRTFVATKEVVQANQFKNNTGTLTSLINDNRWTYIKTPVGIFTEVNLPLLEIEQKLSQDTLNAVKLALSNYNQEVDLKFGMTVPSYLLLVRVKDKQLFFKENRIVDGITSYYAAHNATKVNQYVFTNLAKLVTTCLAEKAAARKAAGITWNEANWIAENADWNKVMLIPVLIQADTSGNILGVTHDLRPGYVRLQGASTPLTLEVTSTNFGGKQ